MKIKRFHQFIVLEKGPVKTAIMNFLKGDLYQVDNEIIEEFRKRNYGAIEKFLTAAEREELLIEINEGAWLPEIIDKSADNEKDLRLIIEIDDGVELNRLIEKFKGIKISRVFYYGSEEISKIFPFYECVKIEKKGFNSCRQQAVVSEDFSGINKITYEFTRHRNSCWGNKLAITKDNKVRPCIYSDIIVGDIYEEKLIDIIDKMGKYWHLTKDKIQKCKDCELRYVCFDCREAAIREGGNLYAANPYCKYNPLTGVWG